MIGNRGIKYGEGFPSTIQTAILDVIPKNSDISQAENIYDENRGYHGVSRFYDNDIEGLIEEIIHISDYLSSPLIEDNQTRF